jgi:Family of unknown function (DUF6448)
MVDMSFNKMLVSATLAGVLAFPGTARAHCDTLDGPVVKAAQRALATGNVTPALIWVEPAAEAEVRDVFTRTMAVRQLNAAARELADRYFHETVVRLHRAGEGEPFSGVEPAGYDVGPAIPAADRALESASLSALAGMLSAEIDVTLQKHFSEVLAARAAMTEGDVRSGRAYVKAYVEFMHYVERLHDAATSEVHGLHDGDAVDPRK